MKKYTLPSALSLSTLLVALSWATPTLEIVPDTFDFGWCPDDAQVSCEFQVKNTTEEVIPLMSVEPSCGCTASNFTPADLSSMDETKIGLTFNTRGYAGRSFNKRTSVKTDLSDGDHSVWLKGRVMDPAAKVHPVGNGIAEFKKGTKEKVKVIPIVNKTGQEVSLDIIQPAAKWASVKLASSKIKPGEKVNLSVSVKPPFDSNRHSSVTLEAIENTTVHRLTVAIRTGEHKKPRLRIKPPPQ